MSEINKVKQLLMKQFEMTNLGQLSYFLGIEFKETEAAATPAETGLMMSLNDEGELADATLYRQIVGSLMYLCNTRLDIAYSVGIISRFMKAPKISHMMAAKRILRYVKGTTDYGVLLPFGQNESNQNLLGYTDSDWRKDKDDRKSTAAYVFMYGGALISWSSKKEDPVALSTCEAEYIAASLGACQGLWLRKMLKEMKIQKKEPIFLLIDNKSAISLAKNPIDHGNNKHIDTRYHFIRDKVEKGKIKLIYCK
ncbi:secreted RxLR effector protein 161-like [Glycine max]|uniref:secreted RxLR effector protein 161-like n=1 Tax=Glycine max TaxID=3847 RepID=UPI001B3557FC|nr:secreted RxLR effector protein 161-like [Glycine max]